MTNHETRREFLADVGRGMLVASIGPALAVDLGLAPAGIAADGADRLTFGAIEPLVGLMEETPIDRFLPAVVERIKAGEDLRRMVAAAALANARAFGGQDYTGYHAIMALAPAYQMAGELPDGQRALPVLKVLYRNTNHIQQQNAHTHEALHPLETSAAPPTPEALRDAIRRRDLAEAEGTFAAIARGPLDSAYNDLQYAVQDYIDVHRVVLAWRSWALLDFTGKQHAHTLLRQSVRFCVDEENSLRRHQKGGEEALRAQLPRLLERRGLVGRSPGDKRPDDAWVQQMCHTIYASRRDQAAEAVTDALLDGVSPEVIGEAISLAANQLVLHDPGRRQADTAAKPKGSVHGASVGVHASDAANAWRNIARVCDRRNLYASLIVGAYHTAGQSGGLNAQPYPFAEHDEKVRDIKPDDLVAEAESAVKAGDQARACALVHRYGQLGRPARPVFDMLLRYAISEDGALHAEKYYRTVTEEFATTRPTFRWRQLAALARVTASEYGHPAPGVDEARRLLGIGPVGAAASAMFHPGRFLGTIGAAVFGLGLVVGPGSAEYSAGPDDRPGAVADAPDRDRHIGELRRLGATVFERDGDVVEVNLNRTKVRDGDLGHLAGFTAMTDLSLEETAIGDDGSRRLSELKRLVWLNLYRTRVGDEGLKHLAGMSRLEHLPIGETRVTDAGLAHLTSLRRLTYLGLRGDRISDAGLRHVGKMTRLTGLNLAQTRISDRGLIDLKPLVHLQSLWLNDTRITDASVPVLARFEALENLYLVRTDMTIEGVKEIQRLRPTFHIFYRSEREAQSFSGLPR